ncbi:terminase small subunit protein [Neorhizobium sp. P12A]|uniref:terminase small subunit-like protein n=1 Tax=Neorhizobium sp. P12A TaxID=2268027 RepID=UPI0011EE3FE9|nr:terminase small subunit protein [Neorhizobium sp. P12A]KAA0697426.1 terminase small subunit protein [Neorhizobium sp. P12A]
MTGRPVEYSVEIADKICELLSDGEKSLRSICAMDGMPSKSTVFRWLSAYDDFRDQYARAREAQADAIFDDILDIADTPMLGEKTKVDKDGNIETTTGDMIEHRKLQIDARKWMAGKLRPKVYGDKLDIDLNGKVDYVVSAKPMSEEEWLKNHGADE